MHATEPWCWQKYFIIHFQLVKVNCNTLSFSLSSPGSRFVWGSCCCSSQQIQRCRMLSTTLFPKNPACGATRYNQTTKAECWSFQFSTFLFLFDSFAFSNYVVINLSSPASLCVFFCRRHCSRGQDHVLHLCLQSSSTSPVQRPSWSPSSDPRPQACPPSECCTTWRYVHMHIIIQYLTPVLRLYHFDMCFLPSSISVRFKVLSSKLMPTSDDEMAKTSSKSFCENFLKAGGLR